MKKYIAFLSALSCVSCQNPPQKVSSLEVRARTIHEKVPTLDTHDDISVTYFTDSLNYSQDTPTQVNLPKMEAGGLDVAWFIVYTGQGDLNSAGYNKALANAQAKFDAIHRLVEVYAPEQIGLATSAAEVQRLLQTGKKVAMIGVENAYPLGIDTSLVKDFYDQGARYMSLAHNGHSQFADSNTGEFDGTVLHNGLSPLGKEVLKKMNYYGIMVDLSHLSKEAIRQCIALSKAPVIASHSSARALSDHPRNLDDEQLGWIKENGGVVQAVALDTFLNKEKTEHFEAARDSLLKANPQADLINLDPVNVSDFVDHIDYLIEKIGIDHVGISSDFDGGGGIDGWQNASETFNVTLELVKRGYSEVEIEKIWGGNLLRVLDEVAVVAERLQNK
ncbi:MAG: dipeptidase [Flavobacteriaceae bacterium]